MSKQLISQNNFVALFKNSGPKGKKKPSSPGWKTNSVDCGYFVFYHKLEFLNNKPVLGDWTFSYWEEMTKDIDQVCLWFADHNPENFKTRKAALEFVQENFDKLLPNNNMDWSLKASQNSFNFYDEELELNIKIIKSKEYDFNVYDEEINDFESTTSWKIYHNSREIERQQAGFKTAKAAMLDHYAWLIQTGYASKLKFMWND